MKNLPNNLDKLVTIQDAAKYLKVSTKTLRRWEDAGIISSLRTEGGHRRYNLSYLKQIKKEGKPKVSVIESSIYEASDSIINIPQPKVNARIAENIDIFEPKEELPLIPSKKLLSRFALIALSLLIISQVGQVKPFTHKIIGSLRDKQNKITYKPDTKGKVLAQSTAEGVSSFNVNVEARFAEDVTIDADLAVNGGDLTSSSNSFNLLVNSSAISIASATGTTTVNNDLNIGGNTLLSPGDLVIDSGGGGVSIGTGTASNIDLAGDDLFVTGDFEVDGSSYIPTLVINSDTITDITGTGLQVSSGSLQAVLGTNITTGEIEDSAVTTAKIAADTILEVDLDATNDATNGYTLTYDSATGGFTWTDLTTTDENGIETVQESDVTINSVTSTTIDFLGGDFDLSESPAGELNVQLATTLTSVTGVAGNFDVAGQLVAGTADAFTVTTAGEIQIPSTETLQIGSIELNDVGASNVTSGAVLIGVFDELTNSSSTNLQDVLDDLDAAIGAGSSKWSQDTGFVYLTNTTDDVAIGGATVAAANFYFDESASNFLVGTNESANGLITLYSSGAGITDATITTDSAGRLIIDSTNFDVTSTGINSTAIGQTTTAAANFTTLGASSTVTFSALTTAGPVITNASGVLSSEATLALSRGGTGRSITASNGQVVYSDSDSFELTTSGSTDQCLKFQSGSAPTWAECVTSSQVPFQSSGGVITKLTAGDYLSLRYGDAADTQLEIQNTTTGTIPTADSVAINLTGGTTGIVTDGADALFIAGEYGDGTSTTNSLVHLDLDPVNTPSGDETFYAINIDGISASSATEIGINFGSSWDREINFADTSPTISIANTGTLTITDGTNTLFTIADDTSEGDVTATGDLTVNGATSADITTSTTTASLFNTNATTLNIGGAATTLNLADGAITGTVDIGGVTADGATTVNIATNSTSADAINIGNSNASTTVAITGGDDFSLAATGVLTLSASASQTTAIVATDTEYTNFADIGDNDITGTTFDLIGTTATINFTDFDVDSDGKTIIGPDTAGDALTLTLAADVRGLIVDAATTDTTTTTGVMDFNIDAGNAAVLGVNIDFAQSDGAADGTDAIAQNINLSANDATGDVFGISITGASTANAASGSYEALLRLINAEPTAGVVTDAILIDSTSGTDTDITDAIDASDDNIVNAINIGANAIAGTNFAVSAAGTITIASGQTLTIGTTSLNETTATADSGASLVGTFDEFTNSNGANVQDVLDDLDAAIGAGSSKWSINTTPTPDVLYPTLSDTTAGNDLAIGGTAIATSPFAVDVSANTIYVGDAATAGSTSVIFKSDAGGDTGTLAYNTDDQFSFTGGDVVLGDTLTLTSDANQGINGGGLTDCDDPTNSKLLWDAGTNKFSCGTDGGAGSGTSKWTDGGATTYLTEQADDIAVGGTSPTAAPFGVDESANTIFVGEGANSSGTITFKASDADTGNLAYTTNDQFNFVGGDVLLDQDLLLTSATPSITLTDSDGASDDYSVNVNASVMTIVNDTDSRTEISFAGDGGIDFADNTATKNVDIGGVTASAADTINISTNGTAADTISIGNSNASTTVAITGGDDWSITAAGALDINGQFDLGDAGDTGTLTTSDWSVGATGNMAGIGSITADGAISFTPGSTSDIVFTGDADSNFQVSSTVASDVTLNIVDITLSATGTGTTGTLNGLAITNAAAAGTTTPDSLVYIAQSDTDETITNGIFIENTAGGTLSTGLRITESAGTITDAILVSGTLSTILNTDSLDISGGGAITGATGIVSSGTITFSGLSTGVVTNTSGTLSSEAQLALTRGGTNKNITATAGTVVYSDADSFELTAAGSTGQCLISNGSSAPSWTNCDNAATTPFTTSGGIIDKTTAGDRLRLLYGDAADTQLTIENTTNATIPTADAFQIDLTGGTTGIITDGVDGLFISTEFGNGTSSTRSALHLDVNPVDSPTSDDTMYALNIDSISSSSAVENAINIGAGWDRALIIDGATTNNSLASTTSGVVQLNIDADPAAAGTNQGIYLDYETIDDANADQTFRAQRIDFLNSSEDAADTTYALSISNANNTSGTAVATDALIHLDNADATASSLTDAIIITSSGVDTGITDAIDVSATNIANAINLGGNWALFNGIRAFSAASGDFTIEDTSGNDYFTFDDDGAASFGASTTTAITLTTDSTGDAELTVPTGSISGTEILDDTVVLTTDTSGNYVATITAGNGISGASSTEGGTPTIALSALTSNWSQTGAFDIVLNNADSQLGIRSADDAAFFGSLDVTTLGSDRTYTFPDATGTVCLSTGNCTGLGGEITGSGAAGQVAYFSDADSITSENMFEYDSTNDVLSLGTGAVAGDTSALLDLYGESEYQVLRPADVTTEADTNNSPILRLRGTYDSDVAVGPVTSSNFNFDIRNIMTAAGASPTSRLDFLNNGGAQMLSVSSAGVVTIPGSSDGTDALVLTAGDILVTNGDFDLSGGDFNVVLDAADGVNISKGAAPTVDVFTIAGGSPATNGVDALALTLTATDQTNFTNSLINGSLTAQGTTGTDIARGLFLDLASQAGGTEKAIEIENTATWDTDIELQNDETIVNSTDGTIAFGATILSGVGTTTIVSDQTTVALLNSVTTTLNLGGAATTFNIGPTGSGAGNIVLAGGSSDTGCTLNQATGDFNCAGTITSSSGALASTLQNAYDNDANGSNATITLTANDDGIVFTNPDSTGNDLSAFVFQINQSDTDAAVAALDITQVSTNAAASAINITSTAATTSNIIAFDNTGNAVWTGNIIDITTGTGNATGNLVDLAIEDSANDDVQSIVLNAAGALDQAGWAYEVNATGAFTAAAFDVDSTAAQTGAIFHVDNSGNAAWTGHILDIETGTGDYTGNILDVFLEASTGNDGNVLTVVNDDESDQAGWLANVDAQAAFTSSMIQFDSTTNDAWTGNLLDIDTGTGNYSGNVLDVALEASTNNDGQFLVITNADESDQTGWLANITSSAAFTSSMISFDNTANSVWTGDLINITTGTGDVSGDILDITFEAGATDVQGIVVNNAAATDQAGWLMNTTASAAWTANAINFDQSAGISTADVISYDNSGNTAVTGDFLSYSSGTGDVDGDVFDITVEAGATSTQIFDVNNAATSDEAGWLMEVDTTGVWTGNAFDFTTGAQAWTGNVMDFNFGNAAATGDVINIDLPALAVGAQAFVLTDAAANTVDLFDISSTGITTGRLADINAATNTFSSGTLLNLSTTSTGVTGTTTTGSLLNLSATGVMTSNFVGNLAYVEWNPSSTATGAGNLFTVNIDTDATTTGDLFQVQDSSSDLFRVNESIITSALPHEFTAAGDVSMAYDLIFTNETSSKIQARGPFTIEQGDSFESNPLTLQVYNAGNVVVDGSTDVNTGTAGVLDLNVNSITASNVGLNVDYTSDDGVTSGDDLFGAKINLTQNDANGDMFGLVVTSASTTNAAAGSYETLVTLNNLETTANSVTDYILITTSAADSTSDAIDVSDSDLFNSINVGANPIVTGNVAGTIGDATTDSWTLLTDSTGNAEIVLPNDAIGPDEVLSAGQTDEYCLTYETTNDTWEWFDCTGAGGSTLQTAYNSDVDGGNATIALTANDDGIVFTNPDVTGNDLSAFVLQINQSDTDAAVAALDLTQVSTNSAASAINITSTAATTSNIIALDNTGDAAWTGNMIDITTGTGNATGNLVDLAIEDSANDDVQAIVLNAAGALDQAGWAYELNATGAFTAAAFDIDSGAANTGAIFHVDNTGNAAWTGHVLDIETGTGNYTGNIIDVFLEASTNNDGNFITLVGDDEFDQAGWFANIDAQAAFTTSVMQFDSTTNDAWTGNIIDIDTGTGNYSGNLIDVALEASTNNDGQLLVLTNADESDQVGWLANITASAAWTANAINFDQSAGVSTADVISYDNSGNTAVTGDFLSYSSGTGDVDGDVFDITVEAGATSAQIFDVNNAATSDEAGWLIEVDTSGIWTGNMIDIAIGAQAATGEIININTGATAVNSQALVVTTGSAARTASVIQINDQNTTGTVATFDIDGTGTRGGLFDIDWSAALATENLIDIDANSIATASIIDITANGLSTGTGIAVASSGTITTGGELLSLSGTGITTGRLLDISSAANTLNSGQLVNISSSATSVTTGSMFVSSLTGASTFSGNLNLFEYSGAGTATGDLLRLNIGSSSNVGNLFNVTDNSSSLFKVNETTITSALPHEFTAAGDVSIAYDLIFTNQTASTIRANGPLTIEQGESSENNTLTIQTYGTGFVDIEGSSVTLDLTGGTTDEALCGNDADATTNDVLVDDCSGTPALDYAEVHPTASDVEFGDIVTTGTKMVQILKLDENSNVVVDGSTEPTVELIKSESVYQNNVIGIASNNYGDFSSIGHNRVDPADHPLPIALNGRVPVKVSQNSEAIMPGDMLTTSSDAGKAMKATAPGFVIAKALDSWTPGTGQETVMVFISNFYYNPSQIADNSNIQETLTNLQNDIALLQTQLDLGQEASSSANFADLTVSNLSVLGDTVLGDTVINGKLNVGTLQFDNTNNSIDAIGVLKIQPLALANVEFLGGLITFDTQGNITAKEITAEKYNVNGASAGEGTLLSNEYEVFIYSTAVTPESLIMITPKTLVDYPLVVTDKQEGVGFKVKMSVTSAEDTLFDWFIVDKLGSN